MYTSKGHKVIGLIFSLMRACQEVSHLCPMPFMVGLNASVRLCVFACAINLCDTGTFISNVPWDLNVYANAP